MQSWRKGWLNVVMVKMKYVIEKTVNGTLYRYWQPKPKYLVDGEWKKCALRRVRLGDDWIAKATELTEQLEKWRKGYVSHPAIEGSVSWLIGEYRKDIKFRNLAPGTQKLYLHYLEKLRENIGDFPLASVTRQHARKQYQSFGPGTRAASNFVQIARIAFNYAADLELLEKNPFERMGIPKDKPRQAIIPPDIIERAKTKAVQLGLPSIAMAIQLGYDSGQRPGDIRMLPRPNYDGVWLRLKQAKTKAIVDIPVFKMPVLKGMLDALSHDSVLILHEERTGQPYTKDMLCTRVREVFTAIGVGKDLQFRDLRRTAVVRLAESGCTIPEICAITGHSLTEATEILEVYLPLSRQMAENAADKVLKVGKTTSPTG